MQLRDVVAEINLAALRNNFCKIKTLAGGAIVCAVVKADAYGHGAVPVAKTLVEEGVGYLAVALGEEAAELRAAGITLPILILGEQDPGDADELVRIGATMTVFSIHFVKALSEAARRQNKIAKVHIKIETGMNRQGIELEGLGEFARSVRDLPGIDFEGVYSHFADADNSDGHFTELQYSRFAKAVELLESSGITPRIRHIANSPNLMQSSGMRLDMVRSGILLYGLSPSSDPKTPKDFEPVMRLVAKISSIKEIGKGETVSYGRTFRADEKRRIALLRIGYADGYLRAFSNRAEVLIAGCRAKVAGKVCMDMTMVDVTGIPSAKKGDEATLFGTRELPAGELATLAGTIDYEITCLVSKRVPRVYLDNSHALSASAGIWPESNRRDKE